MKIVVRNEEKVAVKGYLNACVALANKIDGENFHSLSDLELDNMPETMAELGIQIISHDDETEILIPVELTKLYMELCTEFIQGTEEEVVELYNLGMKYKDVIVQGIKFISVLDAFSAPVKEIKTALSRYKKTSDLLNSNLLLKVESYIERITRG